MANMEHLDRLKQGVDIWNTWRQHHPGISPDLSGADLSGAKLSGIDLSRTNLRGTTLSEADLSGANFVLALLDNADLKGANLSNANLTETFLNQADLSEAILSFAILNLTDLKGTNLKNAIAGSTIFVDIDFSRVNGLETVQHEFPSSIGIDTIYRSQGNIPEKFLRGAGVPETFLAYMQSLVSRPIDYYSCFISYSSKDQEFVQQLFEDLQSEGIRCWTAFKDLKPGDQIVERIEEAIGSFDKLLLVISEDSIRSTFVNYEITTILQKEQQTHRTLLFPIRIDDSFPTSIRGWSPLIFQRNAIDFRDWRDSKQYKRALFHLIKELQVTAATEIDEYKRERSDDR
jgi:uncharacterized protein YjbI with pentapeptide repeats